MKVARRCSRYVCDPGRELCLAICYPVPPMPSPDPSRDGRVCYQDRHLTENSIDHGQCPSPSSLLDSFRCGGHLSRPVRVYSRLPATSPGKCTAPGRAHHHCPTYTRPVESVPMVPRLIGYGETSTAPQVSSHRAAHPISAAPYWTRRPRPRRLPRAPSLLRHPASSP
jgi:hypothetical protein